MIQELEDAFGIIDPWQELVPLVCAAHGEARSLPFLLLGVGEGDGSVHDSVEELVALLGDFILGERSNQLHCFQSLVDLIGGGSRVPENLRELLVDPVDLSTTFMAETGRFSFITKLKDSVCELNSPLINDQQVIDVQPDSEDQTDH